ncbi:MAG: response regulator [Desulfobulbaceae bacterium]|nr:response regulator [Desulfobulbaceae bacterium]
MKNPEKILLVEDDRELLKTLREHLRDSGLKIRFAASGNEALKLAASAGELDLLITDVLLPDLNGIELAKRLLARQPGLKVAFMSGYLRPSLADPDAAEAQPTPFIQKPFSGKTLTAFIRKCLRGEEAEEPARTLPKQPEKPANAGNRERH